MYTDRNHAIKEYAKEKGMTYSKMKAIMYNESYPDSMILKYRTEYIERKIKELNKLLNETKEKYGDK